VIPFLLVIVVIVVVGASVLAYRNRPESSIESGIRSFRREMRALAPPPGHRERGSEPDDAGSDPHHQPPTQGVD
jgi:hypothetical protein